MKPASGASGAGLAIGLGLVVIAGLIAYSTSRMQIAPSYARIGPHIFPYFVSIALALVGAYFVWNASARGVKREIEAEGFETDWKALAIIAAGLLVNWAILRPLGFIIAATVLFLCVSFAFGSRRYLRDVVIAVLLALISYLGFRHGLGLQLPAGIFAGIL
jgi:putative tricarboxylic transport membrane protein